MQDELDEADLFISVISEIELFSKPSMPTDEEEKLRSFIRERISVMNITNAVKEKTIELRRTTKLKLPDCIIAATSIVLDTVLVTNDLQLVNLSIQGYKLTKNFFLFSMFILLLVRYTLYVA